MSRLYTDEEFANSKNNDLLSVECDFCHKKYYRSRRSIVAFFRRSKCKKDFCSRYCALIKPETKSVVNCGQCLKSFITENRLITKSKSGLNFCNRSCSVTYHNTHKKYGIRRSKLEKWLEEQLTAIYPNLEIHYARKDAVNSELDIYIPSLHLAFELNGIFHYEPIFGSDQLTKIQNNDGRKFQACLERGIELCILDTSSISHSVPKNFQKFLNIITDIINLKLA